MNNQDFVKKLAKNGAKKTIFSPLKGGFAGSILVAIYLFALLGFFGLRSDFATKIIDKQFQFELIITLFTSFSSIYCLNYLRFPDLGEKTLIKLLPFFGFIPFATLILYQYLGYNHDLNHINCDVPGFYCASSIIFFALPIAAILFFTLYRGTTLNKSLCGVIIGIASGTISYLFLRLIHATEDMPHLFIWHFLPIMVLITLFIFLANKIIKKL